MVIIYELATDIVMPNISVERSYTDGVLKAYRITANEGYVIYDTTAENLEWDEETGTEIPVNYYFRQATFTVVMPVTLWQNAWVAVLENTVDENYIFGGGDNNSHEVM